MDALECTATKVLQGCNTQNRDVSPFIFPPLHPSIHPPNWAKRISVWRKNSHSLAVDAVRLLCTLFCELVYVCVCVHISTALFPPCQLPGLMMLQTWCGGSAMSRAQLTPSPAIPTPPRAGKSSWWIVTIREMTVYGFTTFRHRAATTKTTPTTPATAPYRAHETVVDHDDDPQRRYEAVVSESEILTIRTIVLQFSFRVISHHLTSAPRAPSCAESCQFVDSRRAREMDFTPHLPAAGTWGNIIESGIVKKLMVFFCWYCLFSYFSGKMVLRARSGAFHVLLQLIAV